MKRWDLPPITLDRRLSQTLQEQIYRTLRQSILEGKWSMREPLPSSRELASQWNVSRNTVLAAYDRLLGEGYLETRPRSGIFVCDSFHESPHPHVTRTVTRRKPPTIKDQERKLHGPMPFHPSQPDVRLFPFDQWNRCRTRALRAGGVGLLDYQSRFTLGLPSLRHQIAEYLNHSRGVSCDWQQVVITSGSQHALFMLGQLLLQPGDSVLMEDPGYPGAQRAFAQQGAKLLPMRIDDQGCIPPKRSSAARLIYTTPSRQYPTGATMSVARRLEMLALSKQLSAWLIEDDYDSEFRYSQPPLPSLHGLDKHGCVLYVGSMSKVLFPSLRIGYVVLPHELLDSFEQLRRTVDDHGPLIDQATLAEFLEAGAFYRHIRRCRKRYGERLDAFLDSVNKHCIPLEFPFTDGGMNQTGRFAEQAIDDAQFSRRLATVGLRVPALSSCGTRSSQRGLIFGFTAFEPTALRSAVALLARQFPT